MRRLLCVIALVGCEARITGLSDEVAVLATIRGNVVGLPPAEDVEGSTYRVGVLWAGVSVFVPYCHAFGLTPADPERDVPTAALLGCTSPFAVVPAVMGPSVPLDLNGDGSFELPILEVPPASTMVGPPTGRVAYGSVIVFEDSDQDGELEFGRRCGGGNPRGGGGTASTDPRPEEPIVASSFTSLLEAQTRVVYVEGAFDPSSNFYPAPSCEAQPRAGFSQWKVGDLRDPSAPCAVEPIDAPLPLQVTIQERHRALLCSQPDRQTFPRDPDLNLDNLRSSDIVWDCMGDRNGTLVVVNTRCYCREVRTYPLAGCRNEVDCPVPEWDFRQNPPEGWPCPPQYGL